MEVGIKIVILIVEVFVKMTGVGVDEGGKDMDEGGNGKRCADNQTGCLEKGKREPSCQYSSESDKESGSQRHDNDYRQQDKEKGYQCRFHCRIK